MSYKCNYKNKKRVEKSDENCWVTMFSAVQSARSHAWHYSIRIKLRIENVLKNSLCFNTLKA